MRMLFAGLLALSVTGCSLDFLKADKDKKSSTDDDDDDERSRKKKRDRDDDEPRRSKSEQCNDVIKTVNASKIGDSVGGEKAQLKAESKEALDLRKKLADLEITDKELKTLMEDYGKSLKGYAEMMEKASEVDDSDIDALMKLVKQASDIAAKNSELTSKINSYCSGN
ncbi:MAG: hypothetical protein HOV80_34400 [Polyangiaceae bacterium]|nr:hypothetical protein [Polyangiaceae bacterium]